MKTADLVIKSAYEFYGELQKDKNGRYRSWEYCYLNFGKARKETNPDLDYLSLQLAKFYQENFEALEEARKNLVVGDMLYPQMKLIDMGFWQIGDVVDREKKNP